MGRQSTTRVLHYWEGLDGLRVAMDEHRPIVPVGNRGLVRSAEVIAVDEVGVVLLDHAHRIVVADPGEGANALLQRSYVSFENG